MVRSVTITEKEPFLVLRCKWTLANPFVWRDSDSASVLASVELNKTSVFMVYWLNKKVHTLN